MKSIDDLKAEHRGIERMVKILQVLSGKIVRGEAVSREDLAGVLEFLKVFVDRCHHGKEEDFLFPALEGIGVPRAGGPIGVMLAEHQQGRALVGNLEEAMARIEAGDSQAVGLLESSADQYADLLRNHIVKEENVLFAMAEKGLKSSEDERLYQAFEKLERERIGAGKHEAFHEIMERLEREHLS